MAESRFVQSVLKYIPRATLRELRDIAQELEDHLEDAAEVLERGGYSPEAAEAEAVKSMGDPAAIGKALNDQLSPFWLWLKRGAQAVCAIAAVGLAYSLLFRFCEPFQRWVIRWM